MDSRVCNFIDVENKCWDWNLLNRTFLPFEVEAIAGIPLSDRMPDDRQVWAETSNGFFSIRSAYKLTLELETNREIGSCSDGSNIWFWKKLWSIQIPHKIRHFAWRAARDILPTKENLVCRKVWLIACVRNAAMLQNLSFICFGSALRFETHGFLHLSSLHCC